MTGTDFLRPELRALPLADPPLAPEGAVRLDANEGAYAPTPALRKAFSRAFRSAPLHRYPHPSALPLREAFASRFRLHPDEVIAGNGASECLSLLMTSLASRRGSRKVLFPWPSFYMYVVHAVTAGLVPVRVPLDRRFDVDEESLLRAIRREKPGLVVFATPNNPTGNRLDPGVIDRVIRRGDCLVALDEAYGEFCGQNSLGRVRTADNLIVLRSMSKLGLAGLRVGFLAASRRLARAIDRARPPYNLSVLSQRCGAAALGLYPSLLRVAARVAADRERLRKEIATHPTLTPYPSDANFVLVRSRGSAEAIVIGLERRGVWVRNLSQPGPLDRCFRVTVGTPHENAAFVRALAQILPDRSGAGRRRR